MGTKLLSRYMSLFGLICLSLLTVGSPEMPRIKKADSGILINEKDPSKVNKSVNRLISQQANLALHHKLSSRV